MQAESAPTAYRLLVYILPYTVAGLCRNALLYYVSIGSLYTLQPHMSKSIMQVTVGLIVNKVGTEVEILSEVCDNVHIIHSIIN